MFHHIIVSIFISAILTYSMISFKNFFSNMLTLVNRFLNIFRHILYNISMYCAFMTFKFN